MLLHENEILLSSLQPQTSRKKNKEIKLANTRNLAFELMHDELNFPGSSALIMFGKTLWFHSLTYGPLPSPSLVRDPEAFLQDIMIVIINRRSAGLRMIIVRDSKQSEIDLEIRSRIQQIQKQAIADLERHFGRQDY